jgi:hypothetical protein
MNGVADIKKEIKDPNKRVKQAIWAYFLLLIFEGALRKWVLPGLSNPLLIIRDPLGLWIIFNVWNRNLFPKSVFLYLMSAVGFIAIITALTFGHGSLSVAIYGARILLIHFPLMYVIGKIFDHDEVIKIGKALLLISIPMAVLIAVQFYSPQSAWVNRGVGGDLGGAGFSGSLGFYRPPATFSFTNGTSLFFAMVACFVVYFLLNKHLVNKYILFLSSVAVIAAIPLSISRSLFFNVVIAFIFAMIATSRNKKYLSNMIVAIIVLVVGFMILSQVEFFQTAIGAFTSRLESADHSEGGLQGTLGDRYLGGLISAVSDAGDKPFFGYGIGMGTSVGSKLLTGNVTYLISEGEWGRLIGEMGPLLGLLAIFIRLGLCLNMTVDSFKFVKKGDLLPWMILSFGLTIIPQGQWSQPTSLGFSTLVGGLIFASFNNYALIKTNSATERPHKKSSYSI